jgi:hypothetical protein
VLIEHMLELQYEVPFSLVDDFSDYLNFEDHLVYSVSELDQVRLEG